MDIFKLSFSVLFFSLCIAFISVACKKSSEALPSEPLERTANYFPEVHIGDKSTWEFSQARVSTSTGAGEYWSGKAVWNVIDIKNQDTVKIITVQRIFSGLWRSYIPINTPPSDNSFVSADTSYFVIKENDKHKITLDLRGNSSKYSYYGDPIVLERYYPQDASDSVNVKYGENKNIIAVIKKNAGLIKYNMYRPDMTGNSSSYTKVE